MRDFGGLTENGRIAALAVLFQEGQQIIADLHVQIYGHLRRRCFTVNSVGLGTTVIDHVVTYLIQQKNIPWCHKAHAQLHASPLAIRDGVHVPVEVHIEDIEQMITALLVAISTY
jgi:hypothetical protein